jgi:hypothetical protein
MPDRGGEETHAAAGYETAYSQNIVLVFVFIDRLVFSRRKSTANSVTYKGE